MASFHDLEELSHRRFNPLSGSWVLVSPNRSRRPWRGRDEPLTSETVPEYEAECYLCPGNIRANGHRNSEYSDTFLFENDYTALDSGASTIHESLGCHQDEKLMTTANDHDSPASSIFPFVAKYVTGRCYVLSLSPKHNATLSDLDIGAILRIVDAWTEIYRRHATIHNSSVQLSRERFKYMHIFENKGLLGGASSLHPHSQIWLTSYVPEKPAQELENMKRYHTKHGCTRHLLLDYVRQELKGAGRERIVWQNEGFIVVCPWWAIWPFEVLVLPKWHVRSLIDLSTDAERGQFAETIREVGRRYDAVFGSKAPYVCSLHQASLDASQSDLDCSYLHMHFYPPLLQPTVRKFFGGYELGAEPLRDLTPELAAARLRDAIGTDPLPEQRSNSRNDDYGMATYTIISRRSTRKHGPESVEVSSATSFSQQQGKEGAGSPVPQFPRLRRVLERLTVLCSLGKGDR